MISEEQSAPVSNILNFAIPTIHDSPHGSAMNQPLRMVTEEKTSASLLESPVSELDCLSKLIEELAKLMPADLSDQFLRVAKR